MDIPADCHRTPFLILYLDSSLSDGDGLLLHGFMDGHLVLQVHLIKLINTTYSLIQEVKGKSIDLAQFKTNFQTKTKSLEHTHTQKKKEKLLNQTTYIISQHEGSSFYDKLMRLLVFDHSGGETGGTAGFTARIHSPGNKVFNMPERERERAQ